jgi:hypothetical protein
MREFGPPISQQRDSQLREVIARLFDELPDQRDIKATDYGMEPADQVVIHARSMKLPDGQRLRLAQTEPAVRPPFEWRYELSSDVDEVDYFKHYLVRDHDIVFAMRKILTPIDDIEAAIIEADIATVRLALGNAT